MKKLRHYVVIFLAAWSMIAMPSEAFAYQLLFCNDNGSVGGGELFYAQSGQNTNFSFCQYENQGFDHVFSQVACSFTVIVNEVLGKMYCGLQNVLQPVVAILLTLYIMIFGVQLLMGTAQLTIKEALTRLLKIALVWTFVSQSTLGINLVFTFFLDLANQGVWWSLSALEHATHNSGYPSSFHMYESTFGGLGDVMPAYWYIDDLIKQVVAGPLMAANSELVAFFGLMGFLQPPIFIIAVIWLITTVKILARALISFLMAISALAFLISLSPIFMSFMLFKVTAQFFESWLRFMISYALQIAIVFACIAMWAIAIMQFVGFFSELASVIFPYHKIEAQSTSLYIPNDSLGVCPYNITLPPGLPHVKCSNPIFNPDERSNPRGLTAAQRDKKAIIPLSNIAQKANENPHDPTVQQTALNALIYYMLYYLISLIIICYAFDALLRKAPEIAIQLAGPEYVPILGQSWGYVGYGVPGKGGRRQGYVRETPDGAGGGLFGGGGGGKISDALQGITRRANQLVETRGKR